MITGTRGRPCLIVFGIWAAVLVPGSAGAADRLRVVATTVQVTALTREVAGDLIELRGIVPAGADPHEFEPVASDLVAVERAHLILRQGIGLDDWLDRTLKAGKRARVVTVTRGVRLEKMEEGGHAVDDPPVWHDPANAERMVENITAARDRADPTHRGDYDANAAAYKSRLEQAGPRCRRSSTRSRPPTGSSSPTTTPSDTSPGRSA